MVRDYRNSSFPVTVHEAPVTINNNNSFFGRVTSRIFFVFWLVFYVWLITNGLFIFVYFVADCYRVYSGLPPYYMTFALGNIATTLKLVTVDVLAVFIVFIKSVGLFLVNLATSAGNLEFEVPTSRQLPNNISTLMPYYKVEI